MARCHNMIETSRACWVILAVMMIALAGRATHAAADKGDRPNIVVFITDDESWLERSAYGWSTLPTPAFDRVARQGVLFTHGYAGAPSCAPSRASLLTGRNFWELEQGAYIQAWVPGKFALLPNLLKDAGYHVGKTGKVWGPGIYPDGALQHEDYGEICDTVRVDKPEEKISPTDYADNFDQFVKQRPADKPFYFWVGVQEPHGPWAARNYIKLAEHCGMQLADIPMPGFMRDTPAERRKRANMLYEIYYADLQLARIIKTLEDAGQLDNTLLIVTSDNGSSIPRSKASAYDWGVHVPLAIMWPRRAKPGRTVDDFVKFSDLTATMLEAANVKVPESMTGKSALSILTSDQSGLVDPSRDHVVTGIEWHGEFDPVNRAARMIRDQRYEYIINYGSMPEGRGREELYDLKKDRWQMHNRIDDAALAAVRDRLKKQLHEYQQKTHDPRVTGDMKIFNETRQFVQERKRAGYPH